jgi:hypothetical protein
MKELRYINCELRAGEGEDERIITGTPIVFNSESQLLGGQFREIIKPEAVTDELLSNSDITMLYNHDTSTIPLARWRQANPTSTLKVWKTERGIEFSFKARKNSAFSDEILSAIRAGDLQYMSFGFTLEPNKGNDVWEKRSDGTYLRTIKKFSSIFDFSIVINPAYQATDVSTRGLEELQQHEQQEIQKHVEELKHKEELRKYYSIYDNYIKSKK